MSELQVKLAALQAKIDYIHAKGQGSPQEVFDLLWFMLIAAFLRISSLEARVAALETRKGT